MNAEFGVITAAIDDLARDKDLIEVAIKGLEALRQLYGDGRRIITSAPTAALPPKPAEVAAPVTTKRKYNRRSKPVATKSGGQRKCEKHPTSPFTPGGRCRKCGAEQMARWSAEKKKKSDPFVKAPKASSLDGARGMTAMTDPELNRRAARAAALSDEREYSKPMTCPKCHATNIRFSRPEDFDPLKDSWTCSANGCQVRISHINLAVDRGYEPENAA